MNTLAKRIVPALLTTLTAAIFPFTGVSDDSGLVFKSVSRSFLADYEAEFTEHPTRMVLRQPINTDAFSDQPAILMVIDYEALEADAIPQGASLKVSASLKKKGGGESQLGRFSARSGEGAFLYGFSITNKHAAIEKGDEVIWKVKFVDFEPVMTGDGFFIDAGLGVADLRSGIGGGGSGERPKPPRLENVRTVAEILDGCCLGKTVVLVGENVAATSDSDELEFSDGTGVIVLDYPSSDVPPLGRQVEVTGIVASDEVDVLNWR